MFRCVRVAGHHVRPARIAGRERPQDVTHGTDDVCLDLAQARERGDPVFVALRQPAAHLGNVRVEEARELHSLFRGLADEAGCSGHSVREHVRSEAAGFGRSSCAAVQRGRQAAFGVRERNEDLIRFAARFRDSTEGLFELVFTELDLERAHDGYRDDCRARQHLLGFHERRKVDSRHPVAQAKRLLTRLDRLPVILAWPAPQLH